MASSVIAVTANAADLPSQSRLGAVFAEPAEVIVRVDRTRDYRESIVPFNLLPNPLWYRGGAYYGSSWSYHYPDPYYGGPYDLLGPRLPYVCGFYGYC